MAAATAIPATTRFSAQQAAGPCPALPTSTPCTVVSAAHCALCHDYTGTRLEAGVVRQTIQNGLDGIVVSCTDCHTAQRTNHYEGFTHSEAVGPGDLSYDAPGQPCGNCHVVAQPGSN